VTAKRPRTELVEVIGPAKQARFRATGGLTEHQVEFRDAWPGEIHYVRSVEEAQRVIGRTK
jgi:hypothetical protein